ncbi:MAG: FAD synthetase family protein [Bacteroidales bacterium]|nr:FAD synthetase family protein [Bacteroidales bacterium]
MKVFRSLDEIAGLQRPVVAIGSFDGVHLGHCRILQYLCSTAVPINDPSAVRTFHPHPQQLLRPHSGCFNINTLDDNLRLIEAQGVEAVVVVPFTKAFSLLSYSEFLEKIVIGKLHAAALVMGPNHALGHNREGSRQQIEGICAAHQLQVVEIPEFMLQDAAVHSATIREFIRTRQYDKVDAMLGYHYVPVENEK